MQCRQPQEILAVLTDIQAAMLESGLSQAKAWTDLTQEVQEQYSALSRAVTTPATAAASPVEVAPMKPAAKAKASAAD